MLKYLFVAFADLFLFALPIAAQDDVQSPRPALVSRAEEDIAAEEEHEAMITGLIVERMLTPKSGNDPTGMFMVMIGDDVVGSKYLPDIQKELGITKEQTQRLTDLSTVVPEELKERIHIVDEMFDRMKNPEYEISDTEWEAMDSTLSELLNMANRYAAEVYSPEQIQKMDSMFLALTGGLESPFLNDRHMTALDMTEEQKQQFAKINDDLKAEREKMVAGIAGKVSEMQRKKEFSISSVLDVLAQYRGYAKELKKRRQTVLTAAQISKMRILARLPKSLSVYNLLPKWMPSADSWKPGDLIPEGLAPDKKETRPFPRKEEK